jgi:arylsulfatase
MIKAGKRSDAIGTIRDLLPTFIDLAGMKHPGTSFRGREVMLPQGRSLLPLLRGEVERVYPEDAYFGNEMGQRSLRQGDWKIVWDTRRPVEERKWQLFNLKADISEQNDLAAREPARTAALAKLFDQFVAENGVILQQGPPAGGGARGSGPAGARGQGPGGPPAQRAPEPPPPRGN